jgi:hypothetical protein
MTHNELITELVTYDGWVFTTSYSRRGYVLRNGNEIIKGTYLLAKQNETDNPILIPYLTDMNILHRLAVKVVRELFALNVDNDDYTKDMDIKEVKSWIDMSMYNYSNDKGEHIQLATALVNAIRYISANKA